MSSGSDMDLLRAYLDRNSEEAFAGLIHQHINLVHSVAVRYAGNPHDAQDVTQAVFIILAQKAQKLRSRTTLTGWLYETTRLTSRQLLRTRVRRQAREHQAFMQSDLNDTNSESVWQRLAPTLEEAMDNLSEKERALVALHFFENKTFAETSALLGIQEWTARKRVERITEKLRRFFTRRGVLVPATVLTAAISAHSVQAAPAALSNAVAAAALSKSVAAGASTLTLIKGALKIMAWSKAKTAVVIGAGILLAAGTGTITVKEIHARRAYPWQVQYANSDVLRKVPPQVKIVPARFRSTMGAGVVWENDGQAAGSSKVLGISQPVQTIVTSAYGQSSERTLFSAKVPSGKFDFIANLPSGNREALQNEIRQTFALTGRQATKETEVLLLKVSNANASGLKPNDPQRLEHNASSSSRSGAGYFNCRNQRISNLAEFLESHLKVPVVDQTQLTGNFDVDLKWDESDYQHPNEDGLKQAVLDQLGLELVPAREPVQMLVVEKAK